MPLNIDEAAVLEQKPRIVRHHVGIGVVVALSFHGTH
jgi:hypothetical protein